MTARPDFYRFHNGEKAPLPFAVPEYEARAAGLRAIMEEAGGHCQLICTRSNAA